MMTRRAMIGGAAYVLASQVLEPLRALAAEARRVRIANVESYRVRVPTADGERNSPRDSNYAVTRVHTDAGVTGTSFIGCPADVLERWVKPTLVGDDLFAVDRHLDRLQMERGESGVQSWSGV